MSEQSTQEKPVDRREIVAEVRAIRDKNAHAISQMRELFDKAEAEKKQRDEENATVKKATQEISKARSELKDAEAKSAPLEKERTSAPYVSPEKIKAEIQSLEYSLHVSYSPAREKQVSRQVKELTKELKAIEATAPKLAELRALRLKQRELRKQLSHFVKELKTHAAKSEGHHQKMLEYYRQADQLRATLPEAFTELDEKRALLDDMFKEEREQRKKDKQEFDATRQVHRQEQQKKMDGVKQKAEDIMKRFKLGEPISFDELQVLQAAGIEV